jgi:hypothetical protein
MKQFLYKIYSRTGVDYFALVIVLTGIIWSNVYYKLWRDTRRIIVQDVILYYEYLPSVFIYKDISMSFTEKDVPFFRDKIWKIRTKTGRSVTKMTMGLSVLYSPFFFAAHGIAKPAGYPADGYSMPYRIALIISSVVYTFFGLLFLIRLLRKYFARNIVALTILSIGLGTNLYFYSTIDPTMSHAYSFSLFAVFIFLVDRWSAKQSWSNTILVGLLGGLIILVRPSNGIILILLMLWKVDSLAALKNRIKLFFSNFLKMATLAFTVALILLPQVLYWKYTTGDFFFYSYSGERFFFNDPALIKGIFSYRKGWLIYTPIMAFAMLGMIVLYYRHRKFFWPVLIFTLLNLYIVFSWWCWWYGGGFGQRALVESYAALAIPFAAFTKFIIERKILLRAIFLLLVTGFISLNIFQTWQYNKGIIHWDSMSRQTYWAIFCRQGLSPDYYEHLDIPDYQAAMKGER